MAAILQRGMPGLALWTRATQGGRMAHRRKTIGISTRETADDETRERADNPAAVPDAPDHPTDGDDMRDRQFSSKAGVRSNAQKEAGTRHTEDPAPSTHKVAGAFGKEDRPDEQD